MPSSYPIGSQPIVRVNDIRVNEYMRKKILPALVAGQFQQLDERSQPLLTQML